MKWTESQLEDAHIASANHETQIKASESCGCFYCRKIFPPDKITEWIEEGDGKRTAICPFCGIDSVIGSASSLPITTDFLREMKRHWFSQ